MRGGARRRAQARGRGVCALARSPGNPADPRPWSCLQALNPVLGLFGAIPLAIGILGLAPIGVGALAGPVSFLQVVHALWESLRRHPHVARWLARRGSTRAAFVLERRATFAAALAVTFVAGALPCYLALRALGFGFGRFWRALLAGQVVFGWVMTGICALSMGK